VAEGVVIRPERDADHPVIAEVVRAAFVGHPDEVASFVERIRRLNTSFRSWRWSPRTPPV
jgi:predicted N-acetyltransferase YhbS